MFWFALVLLIIGALTLVAAYVFIQPVPMRGSDDERVMVRPAGFRWTKIAGYCIIALGVICLGASSLYRVSTKNVGIETTFGATSGENGNGLHVKWPWEKVTEMDAAIQTDSYSDKTCIQVRIANQQTACVSVNFQWRIAPNAAQDLFRNYRTFDHVRDALVTRRLKAVLNENLDNYNPLNSIAGADLPPGQQKNPTLSEIAKSVNKQMGDEIGGKNGSIEVLSTIIPIITFDSETQGRINQLQQQVALTRVAKESQKTAADQAAANKALAASVNNSPNVLVSRCINILETMVKNGQAVPAGFSCWPGGSLAGVIANAGGKNG